MGRDMHPRPCFQIYFPPMSQNLAMGGFCPPTSSLRISTVLAEIYKHNKLKIINVLFVIKLILKKLKK